LSQSTRKSNPKEKSMVTKTMSGSWRKIGWIALLLVVAMLTLAACGGDDEESTEEAAAGAAASGPIKFLYFYAADCAPCDEMTPIIDGLEQDFKDKLVVERYDAGSDEGKKLMEQYELENPPSYAMITPDGAKVWGLNGAIHKDMLRQQVQLRTGQ
jgi:thiol-disulfide isomerase/thioredoxin